MVHHEDIESHVRSVEEDVEYWRTKRLEPRVFRLMRKGQITFYDIMQASGKARSEIEPLEDKGNIEERVTALELELGKFIRSIEVATSVIGSKVLVEESRQEAGVYDEKLKLVHREVSGKIDERVTHLERMLFEDVLLVRAVLNILVEKGLISRQKLAEMLEAQIPPRFENGSKIVAKAWLDPEFKSRLLKDAKGTLRELGFALNRTPKLVVLEDTESVRNVIVCTLCSCYPYELLGNPPWWYKHDSYKEAIVRNPKRTLDEMFGLRVPRDVEVRVYDSTSDIRYIVLPRRPDGTQEMSEEELTSFVTKESLIGVGETAKPEVARPRRTR